MDLAASADDLARLVLFFFAKGFSKAISASLAEVSSFTREMISAFSFFAKFSFTESEFSF